MAALVYFMNLIISLHLFVSNLLHSSSLALLEDKQKFKLQGCVGTHKTSISYANISSICIK
jgi:hypothetical protein